MEADYDRNMEAKRRLLLKEVLSIAVAFGEYFTAGKLCQEFQNLLGYSLVTAAFETGFVSVDDLLSQSPNIVCTYIQSKKHYKVEATAGTEATRDISALIRHQGKKKRKHAKQNTAHREYLNRNVTAARSFRSKSTYGVGFVDSSYDTSNDLQPPIHGPPDGFQLPQCLKNGSSQRGKMLSDKTRSSSAGTSLQRARNVSSTCSVTKPSQSNSRTANNKQKLDEQASSGDKVVHSPVVGVQRFLKALKACNGTASSDQLRAAYKMIHNTDWDVIECVKYFGTSSTREMIDAFLKDVVSIVSIKGTGRRLYVLKTEEQGSGNTERQNIIRAGNITRAELFDGLVNILVERYPETVHVNSISKAFLDKYGVSIEPETYLRLPWDKYILKFFSGQIEVDVKGNVSLNTKNPMVNDKLLKKSLNDALEAPIDSDTDSSFYSSDDEVVDDSLSRRLPNLPPRPSVNTTVYVDHCKSMPCAGRGSARPFDRFSKVSRSFHGSSKASCSGDTPDSCSDLAGAGLTNVEPSDLHVVVTRGSGGRYAYMSERTSIASPSTSKESSSSKSTFTSTEPTSVELPSASRISVSSRMAQRLSFDRRLHQKTLASVGDFFQRKNAGEVPKPSLASRVAFPVGNSTLERRFALGHQSKQAQEDVECAHPYYNVHCISKSGDARMWAAKKGLTVKKDSAPNERLIW